MDRSRIFDNSIIAVGTYAESLGPPLNLRCEYEQKPISVDSINPRLSWWVNDARRNAIQTAYQIMVSQNPKDLLKNIGDSWDTGKVESDQSINVYYAGKPLKSRTRYYWKVRTWDRNGKPSEYSEPTWWEMAILDTNEWSAKWIMATDTISGELDKRTPNSKWIYFDTSLDTVKVPKARFRKSFSIQKTKISKAILRIGSDRQFDLYVNGKKIDIEESVQWKNLPDIDVRTLIAAGKNVICVEMEGGERSLCPLRASLLAKYRDGNVQEINTDVSWLIASSERNEKAGDREWLFPETDDSTYTSEKGNKIFEFDKGCGLAQIRSHYFRKEFTLDQNIVFARVYVTSKGLYECHLNGRKVGQDLLTPGRSLNNLYPYRDYDLAPLLPYQVYDVTPLVHPGKNVIGALLANSGYYSISLFEGEMQMLLLEIRVKYADGREEKILTDQTWKTHESPIVHSAVMMGEIYDARMQLPGWDTTKYDETGWSSTELASEEIVPHPNMAQACKPIQVTAELKAIKVTQPSPRKYIFDFGQNAAGRCRLKIRGTQPGTRIELRYAEALNMDGTIARGAYRGEYGRGRKGIDVYYCRGGEEIWSPQFTYSGFRYCEITGYPGIPSKDALVHRVFHNNLEVTGRFKCSSKLLNRIWKAVTWTHRSNIHSVPTDGPTREKQYWSGDAQLFAPTTFWHMNSASFMGKNLRLSPGGVAASGGWSEHIIITPWDLYRFYGDKKTIEIKWENMVSLVESRKGKTGNYLDTGPAPYPDWRIPVAQYRIGYAKESNPDEILLKFGLQLSWAYQYYAVRLLSQMANIIGKKKEAHKYQFLLPAIAAQYNNIFFDEDKHKYIIGENSSEKLNLFEGGTQTSQIIALSFGIAPEEYRKDVMRNLIKDIIFHNYHLTTGFIGTRYLLPTLSFFEKHDVAYKIATQTSYPSWGNMLKRGATTIWEGWGVEGNEEKDYPSVYKERRCGSRNHSPFASIGQWLFECVAGINIDMSDPASPAFKRIIFRPGTIEDLKWAQADYQSMYGLICCKWEKLGERSLRIIVSIPANTTATLYLPTRGMEQPVIFENGKPVDKCKGIKFIRKEHNYVVYTIGSGRYCFEINAKMK